MPSMPAAPPLRTTRRCAALRFSRHTTSSMSRIDPSPLLSPRAGKSCRPATLPSAVPPPALERRSGLSPRLSATVSFIERNEAARLSPFGPSSPCTAITMASADFCCPLTTPRSIASTQARQQISRGKARDFRSLYLPHLQPSNPDDIGLQIPLPPRPSDDCLSCDSCSSGQSFASSFLPTSPRGDAVAHQLGVPVIEAPRGLPPPQSLPGSLSLTGSPAPVMALRAMPGAQKNRMPRNCGTRL